MLDHVGLSVSNIERARTFYEAALAPLGISIMMEVTPEQKGTPGTAIGFGSNGKPYFWISDHAGEKTAAHIAFTARTRAEVDAFHAAASAAGGADNGPPGLRPHYHPDYYGAFVLDADGINVEAVCH